MPRRSDPAVAASSRWTDDDGVREPGGSLHAWRPGTNQTAVAHSRFGAVPACVVDRRPHSSKVLLPGRRPPGQSL